MHKVSFLTVQEAAKFLPISEHGLRHHIRVGHLKTVSAPHHKAYKHIAPDDLIKFRADHAAGKFAKTGRPRKIKA
jgi:hypothetical protein